jgi:PncC family amidohydrolase
MIQLDIYNLAVQVIKEYSNHNLTIATSESCTGGMLSAYLTAVPGSSDVFERGFVTYTNKSKKDVLGVSSKILSEHGAVSEIVAKQMLEGLLEVAPVDTGISITGIAGPGGGTIKQPVGLVYIGYGTYGNTLCKKYTFLGDRDGIRQQATREALKLLLNILPK